MKKIKIGLAPTRRSIFSAPDAVKYANLTRERLNELAVDYVDITDINEEGLLYDDADLKKISKKSGEFSASSAAPWIPIRPGSSCGE